MICTGSILALFEVPILIIGMLLGQYLATQYGFWFGLVSSLIFTIGGFDIFHRWFWGEWPFNLKRDGKLDES